MRYEYTLILLLFFLMALILDKLILKTKIYTQKRFYLLLLLVTFWQLVVDNYLNGRWGFGSFIVGPYPSYYYSGVKIWYTPLENFVFGWVLVWMNVSVFEFILAKKVGNTEK